MYLCVVVVMVGAGGGGGYYRSLFKYVSSLVFGAGIGGVANGTSKNVGLGKFWQYREISEAFLISLEVLFLHGLFLLF